MTGPVRHPRTRGEAKEQLEPRLSHTSLHLVAPENDPVKTDRPRVATPEQTKAGPVAESRAYEIHKAALSEDVRR